LLGVQGGGGEVEADACAVVTLFGRDQDAVTDDQKLFVGEFHGASTA
jgi:hypothetical protein